MSGFSTKVTFLSPLLLLYSMEIHYAQLTLRVGSYIVYIQKLKIFLYVIMIPYYIEFKLMSSTWFTLASSYCVSIISQPNSENLASTIHHSFTVAFPYPWGNLFQDPHLMPETTDGTKPYVHYTIFLPVHR